MLLTSSWILDLSIIIITIIFAAYKYMTRHFDYWEKRGVKGPKPIPFYGNFYEMANFKITISEGLKKLYDFCDDPCIGIFVFDKPVLILKSPELIKDVLISDSSLFLNKTITLNEDNEIIKNLLFFQTMPEWKPNREKLSPCFSPVKIKGMFPLITTVGDELQEYILSGPEVVDVKDMAAKYFVEVIARCMFGIDAKCFQDKEAGFMKAYRGMFAFTWRNAVSQGAAFFMGELVRLFRLDFIETSITEYLADALTEAMQRRERHDGKSRDPIDVLNNIQNSSGTGNNRSESDLKQLQGNVISFLIAGAETTSSTASYALYELAINQHIQDKVRKEIMENIEKHGGITYEGTQETPYLEMCIHETLRKYAVVPHFCRKAAFEYRLGDLTIEKGTRLYIPLYGLQMDEKYFPEPKKFDPDRLRNFEWNQEGKLIFMPFGAGPRHCIGDRFAMTSMKVALMKILSKYRIDRCESTPDELEFETKTFMLKPKTGHLLKLKPLINAK